MVGDVLRFKNLEANSDEAVALLVEKIAGSVVRYLKKKGDLDQSGEIVSHPAANPLFHEHESLAQATLASISGRFALRPNAGQRVTKIGSGFGYL